MAQPDNIYAPISGKWTVSSSKIKDPKTNKWISSDDWNGKVAGFSSKGAKIAEYETLEPGFKVKLVNKGEFLLYKYGMNRDDFGIPGSEANIITVSFPRSLICEIAKISEKSAVGFMQDRIVFLDKVSDSYDDSFDVESSTSAAVQPEIKAMDLSQKSSGLLLGLRKQKNEYSDLGEYSYRTLWIGYDNELLHQIYETDGIFLPRRNGFWKVQVDRESKGDITEDVIKANSISGKAQTDYKLGTFDGIISRKILYIGNDYISTEQMKKAGNREYMGEKRYMMLPVDNTFTKKGVKISELAENGLNSLENSLGGSNLSASDREGKQEDNIALLRKNGHWIMKGGISRQNEEGSTFIDYNINMIPPSKLVFYDLLSVPWTRIKERAPEATDAFTSPNRDIAVVLCPGKLCVYKIEPGGLSEKAECRIKLSEGETVVMAEWSIGDFVKSWEKCFLRNDVNAID